MLSWGTPPSTTDPHKVPYWGNILDARVQLRPGRPYDGNARFTIVGGVEATRVSFGTGLTLPGATIVENGTLLPSSCPFGGLVSWHGPLDPALAGSLYRIRVRNVTASGPTTDLGDAVPRRRPVRLRKQRHARRIRSGGGVHAVAGVADEHHRHARVLHARR